MQQIASSGAIRWLVSADNACRVLVIGLSDITFRHDRRPDVQADIGRANEGQTYFNAETVALPRETFEGQRKGLEGDFPHDVAWQQAIRMLWAHRSARPVVHVIPSKESAGQIDLFRDYATALFARSGDWTPTIQQAKYRGTNAPTAIDYENYDAVFEAVSDTLNRLIIDNDYKAREVCVDATAGQKTFSIAVTVATLNSETQIGYTTNQGVVKSYAVRAELTGAQG